MSSAAGGQRVVRKAVGLTRDFGEEVEIVPEHRVQGRRGLQHLRGRRLQLPALVLRHKRWGLDRILAGSQQG